MWMTTWIRRNIRESSGLTTGNEPFRRLPRIQDKNITTRNIAVNVHRGYGAEKNLLSGISFLFKTYE